MIDYVSRPVELSKWGEMINGMCFTPRRISMVGRKAGKSRANAPKGETSGAWSKEKKCKRPGGKTKRGVEQEKEAKTPRWEVKAGCGARKSRANAPT